MSVKRISLSIFGMMLMAAGPAYAGGLSGITTAVTSFTEFVTSGFGVLLLTVIIMGLGIGFYFNKVSGKGAIVVLGGSFLVFGAPRIAVWLQGLFV